MVIRKPYFSIVTPVLNGYRDIYSYVMCLQSQIFTSWEALVVDDGSTDGSQDLFRRLVAGDERFFLLVNPYSNEVPGPYQARNFGLSVARGEFICFLDIDDYWSSRKLACQHEQLVNNPSIKLLYGDYVRAVRGSATGKVRRVPSFLPSRLLIYILNPIPMLTSCVHRSAVDGLLFQPCHHEDYLFWSYVISRLRSDEIVCSRDIQAVYTVDHASLSGNKYKASIWIWRCYRRLGYAVCFAAILMFARGVIQVWFICREALSPDHRLEHLGKVSS